MRILCGRQLGLLIAAIAVTFIGFGLGEARADELLWRFKSNHPSVVHLKFYSQDRNHVWPSSDEVWVIDDYQIQVYNLGCRTGEKICYGAWVSGQPETYWGAGYDGEYACNNCCASCGGELSLQVLDP